LRPSGIVNGLGQPRPGKRADGEVFGVDRLVVADQPESCLMCVIEPGFPHLAVQHRDAAA
jgi:hypothetical protein